MQAQIQAQREQAVRDEFTQATGLKDAPKSREGQNLLRNWGEALAKTLKHVCTTADRVTKQIEKTVKKIDWKKVAIVAVATVAATAVTIATAGAAGPVIAGFVSGVGLSGAATTVVTAAAVGGVAGAAGGAVSGFTTSVLSGDKPKDVLMNTLGGAWNGLKSGAMTGGLLGGFGAATSSVSGPVARYAVDTFGETAVDTIVDAAQGGQVTPGSIATSLAFNAVTEGITSKVGKGEKADVNTSKPKGGDVPVTKPRKDVTPVQQLALPGPKSQPLALPAPKQQLALPAPEPVLALPAPVSNPSSSPVDVSLKFKDGWTDEQRAQAIQKVQALTDADTVKAPVTRKSTSASSRYKKVNGADSVSSNYDVDYTIDLQLGGADTVDNMNPLDSSVNRSLGSQIHHAIKNYPDGTVFGKFTIED